MKARLAAYSEFLTKLSHNGVVTDLEAEQLRRLATFLAPVEVEAEPENEDTQGLNRWSVRDWAKRPRQTGMEQQNEKVVLELLNLFAGYEIPFYIRDKHGEKTGREYSTPERLAMLRKKFDDLAVVAKDANKRAAETQALIDQHRVAHAAALAELGTQLGASDEINTAVARARVILTNVERADDPVQYGEPDDRGVRMVTIDARGVVLRLCMQRIVHDLTPDQKICDTCLGLGLIKCGSRYAHGERKPYEDAYPYQQQWLRNCPDCYMGVAYLCPLCRAVIPRGRTACECRAARDARALADYEKEMKRRETLPRILLNAYEHPVVWCDDTDTFVNVDHIHGHLEEHPDATFFACEPSAQLTKPEAWEIIERLCDDAMAEVDPEDSDAVLDVVKEGAAELDAFLEVWAKKYVTARDLYYPNMKLIVEVVRGESDDAPV
jgi:hypothetical protein